jgi:hypothetical protein
MDYLPVVSGYLVEKIKFAQYGFPTHQPQTAESKSLLEKLISFKRTSLLKHSFPFG